MVKNTLKKNSCENNSFENIGQKISLSRERVPQIEKHAKQRFKSKLKKKHGSTTANKKPC